MTTGRWAFVTAVVLALIVLVVAFAALSSSLPGGTSVSASATVAARSRAIAAVPSSSPSVAAATGALASAPGAPSPTRASPATCTPTDQDRYVYNPDRLEVRAACLRVTGTVAAIRNEADGDLHILLAIDPEFEHLLTPANQGVELGDLVVEPVCVRKVTQRDAIEACGADPDPLSAPLPTVGAHVWMEGRYVFDLEHSGWAELHPLYRWGPAG
ncbi:MAG TPA: hypothetical protein VIM30_14420 [Candidatus Limnocylindrales bacterium]